MNRRFAKRAFDLALTVPALLLCSPELFAVAMLIKLDDGGPVFFRQERVGFRGRPFQMWKFRTMIVDAERRGGQLTIGGDPRVTRVGRFLRRTKLDELPQLFNVVRGEMSLQGPRPEVPRYVALYSPEQRRVLELVPGITDPASIAYRDESELLAEAADPERTYVEQIMADKIRINLEYADRATLWSDLGVLFRTFVRLFA
jgi:lipopolysaccharide/colanic/teichoic acid biosynthesis glycosyltransferase